MIPITTNHTLSSSETTGGWPGIPYDTWNPVSSRLGPGQYNTLRGWCTVENKSSYTITVRTEGWPAVGPGVMALYITCETPAGTFNVRKDYDLRRGGTHFEVHVNKHEKHYSLVIGLVPEISYEWLGRLEMPDAPAKPSSYERKTKLFSQKG